MEVTVFRRATHWQPEVPRLPEQDLQLPSMTFSLPLKEVYEGVNLVKAG